ncbi:LysR family transcriptional regulator [Pseudoroseomonas deserti]|uniref:LysR family transcriptional regulator n=1 Tax=Teichococcus deserti TaxID=1817963 RepID=A0A1V2GXM8_9PROT|nr:LysR family transcriptional regulator [Pseudoroseomonas deserti]ONG49501.1 LysR family transcriptional regulator [Pseudoroseomonas deserti]
MLPSERLKGIEAFVAAADLGSFTAAAQRLNLTTSAISKSVGRLEVRLGCRLFERTTRRLALTSEGAAFQATCVKVLAELAEAEAVLAAQASEPVGRVKLDVPIAFGRLRVMPLLLRLAERHPALRPHVTFTDRYVDVLEEGIDVAVRIGQAQGLSDGLARRHLGSEHRIFCAAPAYLARRGVPGNRRDLLAADRILYGRSDGTASAWRLGGTDGDEDKASDARLVLGSAEAQVEAVKAGFGIAQLATWLIQQELDRGELVEVLPDFATEGLALQLVWPKSRQLSPKVDALLTLLSAELRID